MTWLPIATKALDDNDISISTSAVKEIHNRIEFGLSDWSQLADAKAAISETEVPVEAVRFVERTIRLFADRANCATSPGQVPYSACGRILHQP